MRTEKIIDIMTALGFTTYEAKAYAALVEEHPLTGYELSGRSGIPRSKIYECIERLDRKKMVLTVESTPNRYVPIPPEELVRRLSSDFEHQVKDLGELLTETGPAEQVDYIFNITGRDDILDKARLMVAEAEETLDCSLWRQEIDVLRDDMAAAARRGVTLTVLSFDGGDIDGGRVYHHRPLTPEEFSGRWITVVRDENEVLTGKSSGENGIVAAWTRNTPLVVMGLKHIKHEINKICENTHQ